MRLFILLLGAALVVGAAGCVRYLEPEAQARDGGAQRDGVADLTATDAPTLDLTGGDLELTDLPAFDAPSAPDAACPDGLTRCGGACVDTSTDKQHCGKCDTNCTGGSDTCSNGTCVCGNKPTGCDNGYNCVQGACACIAGGLCTGCCYGETCVPLSKLTTATCGTAGAACKSCEDADSCTTDSCNAGVCQHTKKADGASCDDLLSCTDQDQCKQGVCSSVLKSTYCLIGGVCYADGAYKSKTQCRRCDASNSQKGWVYLANPGCVTTFAGVGYPGLADGAGQNAQFKNPKSLAIDSAGAIYVADSGNHVIRKITGGQVTTLAGIGAAGFLDGTAASAKFDTPMGVALDTAGNVYVADSMNNRVRVISTAGAVTTLAGSGTQGTVDGAAGTAQFNQPCGVAVDGTTGKVYVADRDNNRIRLISSGVVSTVTGSNYGYQDGPLTTAKLAGPYDLALDNSGYIYIADKLNSLIRYVSTSSVSTFAGSTVGFADGAAAVAKFKYTYGIGIIKSSTGDTILVADGGNNRVRKIAGGQVTTLAGNGTSGLKNGPAATAHFDAPMDAEADSAGKIYIADHNNHVIRLYTP